MGSGVSITAESKMILVVVGAAGVFRQVLVNDAGEEVAAELAALCGAEAAGSTIQVPAKSFD